MKRWIVGVGVVALLAALGAFVWRVLPQQRTFLTDAESIREPVATARVRDVLWEPPTRLPEQINSGSEDYEPRLSADGMTMYFVRGKAGENAEIFLADRTVRGWGDPRPFAEVNSEADDLGPQPSPDGDALYFYSNRTGGFGGYDLWVSRRGTNGTWQPPENLGPAVNSEFNDYGPAVTPDAKTLYFSSNRPQPGDVKTPNPNAWQATLREDLFHRTYDLYAVAITDRGFGRAEPINTLNTPFNEGAPAVSSFGDFLYFASDRLGGAGGFDLYRSRRLRGGHESPTNLGQAVNTEFNELDPALSMGGFGLDFSSDRPASGRAEEDQREYELYHTNSREVFAEAEQIDRPPIDWAGLWAAIGPNLLWALLALLLLLLMLMLFKGAQNRKLSLLMRCLLASLAAHILMMLLFNVWEVAAALAGEFHRKGPIQVALAAPVRGDTIAAQIRGSLVEVDAPTPAEVAVRRQLIPLTAVTETSPAELPVEHQSVQIAAPLKIEAKAVDAKVTPPLLVVAKPTIESTLESELTKVALPPDATRVSETETNAAAPLVPIAARSLTRVAEDIPIEAAITVPATTIQPETHDADSISNSSSLVRSPLSFKEAAPTAARSSLRLPEAPRSLSAASLEPRLPDTPVRSIVQEDEEIHASVSAEPLTTTKAAPLEPDPNVRPDDAAIVMKPKQENQPQPDVPLAAHLPKNIEDAPPPDFESFTEVAPREILAADHLSLDVTLPSTPRSDKMQWEDSESAPIVEIPTSQTARAMVGDVARSVDFPSPTSIALPSSREDLSELTRVSLVDSTSRVHGVDAKPTPIVAMPESLRLMDAPSARLDLPVPVDESPDESSDEQLATDSDDENEEAMGTIHGVVMDAESDAPVRGAMVQLVLPDRSPRSVRTGADGRYSLLVPPMPEFFALSASRRGFVPATTNVNRSAFSDDGEVNVDFKLERASRAVTATEALPDVHHLGDDRFDGTINSQFQKDSEGSSFAATFAVDSGLLKSAIDHAELRLLVKGVQRRHRIYINNHQLSRRLDESPEDGSFGEFIAPFDPSILNDGANLLRIVAAPSSSDIDDFEFVNIRVYLIPSTRTEAAGL